MNEPTPMPVPVPVPKFEVVGDQITSSQVYFDGISGILLAAANCKVSMHQVVGVDDKTQTEQRKVALTAVFPTAALVEFCKTLLKTVEDNKDKLDAALSEQRSKIIGPDLK